MKEEWARCYDYFKNRKFIERPNAHFVNLKQTTINIKNANSSTPKSMSYSQEDSKKYQKQEKE